MTELFSKLFLQLARFLIWNVIVIIENYQRITYTTYQNFLHLPFVPLFYADLVTLVSWGHHNEVSVPVIHKTLLRFLQCMALWGHSDTSVHSALHDPSMHGIPPCLNPHTKHIPEKYFSRI